MIKLIASDLDGTLLPYGYDRLPKPMLRGIYSVLERGIGFAVCSGRTYCELIGYLPEFRDDIYFICCDGAYYVKGGRTLYERRIEKDDVMMLERQHKDTPMLLHAAYRDYSVGNIPEWSFPTESILHPHDALLKEKIYKITIFDSPKRLPPYSGLRLHWDGKEKATTQYVNRFANKGAALSDLQERLFLTGSDTAAIGDAANDIPMMRRAKYSVAVGNRCPELYKVCSMNAGCAAEAMKLLREMK